MKHLLLSLASILAFASCKSTSDCCASKGAECKDPAPASCCVKPAGAATSAVKHAH